MTPALNHSGSLSSFVFGRKLNRRSTVVVRLRKHNTNAHMKNSIVTSIIFATFSILLLLTLSYRIQVVLELAMRQRTASQAEIDKPSASNSQENKSLIVAVGIEQFKIRVLFFGCASSMVLSAICSFNAMKKHMKSSHTTADGAK